MNLSLRVRYSLAVLCLGASTVLGNQAVNQYQLAKTVQPSEDLIARILEQMVRYQQTETVNDHLLAQAQVYATDIAQRPYLSSAFLYGTSAVLTACLVWVVAQKEKKH